MLVPGKFLSVMVEESAWRRRRAKAEPYKAPGSAVSVALLALLWCCNPEENGTDTKASCSITILHKLERPGRGPSFSRVRSLLIAWQGSAALESWPASSTTDPSPNLLMQVHTIGLASEKRPKKAPRTPSPSVSPPAWTGLFGICRTVVCATLH